MKFVWEGDVYLFRYRRLKFAFQHQLEIIQSTFGAMHLIKSLHHSVEQEHLLRP